ncbi:alpha/beta fold hydrolase [Paenibacillus sp. GCM10012303]|uniref:alpha/beta fold hydrolase n=1 Tax=Paenibacillus sp. GCM10012303 TaxID=3317340 RepID=UPI003618A761
MLKWEPMMVQTERGTFELFSAGQGKPLCVTHFYSAFTNKGNFFADLFAGRYRVYLVNLKGAGRSDDVNDESEYSMTESVRDLEAIRKQLRLGTWSFAGHSTGGMLGLVYGIQEGGSLNSLIVAGAAASHRYMRMKDSIYCKDNPRNPRLLELFRILRTSSSPEEIRAAAKEWTEMSLRHPERWDAYFAKPSSGRTVQARLNYYNKQLPDYDLTGQLGRIRTPTFVLCGKYDAQCPLECSQEISALVPEAELQLFEESNHSPHIEEPAAFVEAIDRFYAKCYTG